MNPLERFEAVRKRKNWFSLRARLTVLVTFEIIFCAVLSLLVDYLLKKWFPVLSSFPLLLELILIGALVGMLVTSFLSRMIFDPFKKLREAMGRVAKGDFAGNLETRSHSKEIQEIYTGFNLMTHELRATEILQTDFVSSASHEFKTPVSAIAGYAALLDSCDDLTAEHREYIDKILFNTKRLSTLTDSILLLSKLENQEIPTNQTKFPVDEQIRQSIVTLEPRWESKQIDLDVDLCRAEYYGNELLMRHVWDNLIGNAVKFAPEGSTVKIRLVKDGDRIVFTVDDQGPGIPKSSMRHIFDKFYQSDSAHKQEGSGLGLSLVDKILKLEKGTVKAENLDVGGCRFTVTLNVAK